MEKEKLESLLIDYIDNRLNAVDRRTIEQELLSNADAQKIYEELKEVIFLMETSTSLKPTSSLKKKFDKDLTDAIHHVERSKTIFFSPAYYRAAAAVALMVISGALGFWISKNNAQQERLVQIEREMELTRRQLAETKQLMLGMLENDQSASQRIKGVNVAMELPRADEQVVNVLFKTMRSDPSTNVRLAALEALYKFRRDQSVRNGLINALAEQTDPMVQIRLIQLMVEMEEKAVVDELHKIVDDAGAMKAVKDEAYSGILKLS